MKIPPSSETSVMNDERGEQCERKEQGRRDVAAVPGAHGLKREERSKDSHAGCDDGRNLDFLRVTHGEARMPPNVRG
jgi:hypothetical protein